MSRCQGTNVMTTRKEEKAMEEKRDLPRLRTEDQIWKILEKDADNALAKCDLPALLFDANAYVFFENDEGVDVTLVNLNNLLEFLIY